ncbi:MAG: hypothetical protein LEGION0398_MBIBDBAK_00581 [Legionellaceae bacterium]
MMKNNSQKSMLNRILPKPSSIIKIDRFSLSTKAASCNGRCASGHCR